MLEMVVPSYLPARVGWQEDRVVEGMASGSSEVVVGDHTSFCLQ